MKRAIYTLSVAAMLLCSVQTVSAKENPAKQPTELTAAQQQELQNIKNRVEEIRTMDKSNLTSAERKEIRQELREMKKRADFLGNKVYLSVGALIIIILLLILIF